MAGVYLSYPFCAQKCTFCNFASGVASDDVQRHYERMLLREIEHHDWKWLPETIYWGGGTPSLMPLDEFADAMRAIPAEHIKEATLECAPGSVTADRAQAWRAAGINRVSLGVQSFVEAETRRTGRKHSAEIVERELNMLANAGISNINIDLIAGLPGQTLESWQTSLDWVERLAPPHVSVYMFEIDEDSRLGREALLGGIRYGVNALPPDDAVAEFYERAAENKLGDDAYPHINAAFIEDLLAAAGDRPAERHERAKKLRERIQRDLPVSGTWFNAATRAEALFGLGKYDEATEVLRQIGPHTKRSPWELRTMAEQLAQLAYLREERPLEHPAIRTFFETLLPGASDAARSIMVGKVGLALSGGGSRAIAFHLGCLRALNDLGIL